MKGVLGWRKGIVGGNRRFDQLFVLFPWMELHKNRSNASYKQQHALAESLTSRNMVWSQSGAYIANPRS